jgi:hypothetical protein
VVRYPPPVDVDQLRLACRKSVAMYVDLGSETSQSQKRPLEEADPSDASDSPPAAAKSKIPNVKKKKSPKKTAV